MSIERIKQRAAEADQRIAELAGQPADEQTAVESEAEVVAEVVTPDATEDHSAAAPAADALAQAKTDAAKWEQRYRSLDGMIQARDRQIEQLHQLLAGMQQAAPAAEAPATTGKKLISEKDEEAFGADLIDLARRVAQEEHGQVVTALKDQIRQLTEQLSGVSQVAAVSAQDRFEAQIAAQVPNWKTIDADPAFVDWLNELPTRMRMFTEAARSQDAPSLAYFYKEYADKTAPAAAAATAADTRLERMVAPGRTRSVATPAQAPSEKKQWTRSEIARFYKSGRRDYSPEEYTKVEKDIFAAQREGRVDPSR